MGTRFQDPLRAAVERDDAVAITLLVQAGCTVDAGIMSSILKHATSTGNTSLLQAVVDGGFDLNTNFSGHLGDSLILAITYKHHLSVALLLGYGCDPNLNRRAESDTPLELAAKVALPSIVELLLQHGAQTHNRSALHYAAMNDRTDIAEVLVRHGQDINVIPDNEDIPAGYIERGWGTALHEAVRAQKLSFTKWLLDHGAQTSIKDNKGMTAREVAIGMADEEILNIL
ncbi:ankyrin repeat-containing domain protein [Lophiotrema nucula]|uniref:Ankyrin repeat-containing domain protein n=1 Tax=Lophiotrema nucula TaxID=690887 RepID=A0A6A5YRN1_9PLEO|nr:ankyrin repeat-containing domain protein [Lophiotrema nucula]